MALEIEFPQYRKLEDKSYYKILSFTEMYELQRLGKRWLAQHLIAHTFLDRNLIQDLLESDGGRYSVISQEEYTTIESDAKQ